MAALNDATLHPVAEATAEVDTDTTLELDEDTVTEANAEVDTNIDPAVDDTTELGARTKSKSIHDPNSGEITVKEGNSVENIAELTRHTDEPNEMRPELEVPKSVNPTQAIPKPMRQQLIANKRVTVMISRNHKT